MQLLAHAKINWTLAVRGRRPDGYHLLSMLMQPVTLCDRVILEPAETVSLTITGNPKVPSDERNIVVRAAQLLRERFGVREGVSMHVEKRIPAEAGLGGGSADCAAVLAGLNRLWGLGLSEAELEEIGLQLGADVPFCLRGGLCRVEGIGERLRQLEHAPSWPLILVQPCGGLSTGEVFRRWHAAQEHEEPDEEALLAAVRADDPGALPPHPGNDLEAVSCVLRPEIREAVETLRSLGTCCAQMSGSGSAVFGVFRDRAAADAALPRISSRWSSAWRCETCAESVTLPAEG